MAADIADYIKSCHSTCQTTKGSAVASHGEPHTIAPSECPWYCISCDLITGLPTSKGLNAILTVVDRCTKMVHLIPTHDTVSAAEFAELMDQHVISKHGLFGDIITDRDPRFTGLFWRQVCAASSTHQSLTTAWHPQSDGQTERMNRTIEQVLRAHCANQEKEWARVLCMVELQRTTLSTHPPSTLPSS